MLEGIVNLQGRLAETYPKLDPNTIQHAFEITNDRRTDKDLRNVWFWTADSALYTVEDSQPVLYFGDRDNNLIFRNLEEATEQLVNMGNYKPSKEDVQSVIDSAKTENVLRINLSDLGSKKYTDEWNRFEINTSKYNKLNKTQRDFAERVYGQGDDFSKNMEMLNGEGDISTTRIYVLNPKYVKENAKDGNAVARACWLSFFVSLSYFYAGIRVVYNSINRLRGVLKVAESDRAEKTVDKYQEAYKIILGNHKNALKSITPEVATGISKLLTDYLKQKQ